MATRPVCEFVVLGTLVDHGAGDGFGTITDEQFTTRDGAAEQESLLQAIGQDEDRESRCRYDGIVNGDSGGRFLVEDKRIGKKKQPLTGIAEKIVPVP